MATLPPRRLYGQSVKEEKVRRNKYAHLNEEIKGFGVKGSMIEKIEKTEKKISRPWRPVTCCA